MLTIDERLADISARTGLSKDMIRSVFSATRDSLAESLRREDRATIPGICTFTSEIRQTFVMDDETGEAKQAPYVKVKVKPSQSFEQIINTEESKQQMIKEHELEFEKLAARGLNFMDASVIRTKQIGALA